MKFVILILSLWILLIGPSSLLSQSNSRSDIQIEVLVDSQPLQLNTRYFIHETKDSLEITRLRLYISDFRFLKKGKVVGSPEKRHHLVDIEDAQSMHILLGEQQDFDAVAFNIGIDSTTNMAGAQGGDLDPVNGMYWTWQSGYINFKLEGKSSLCPTRGNRFTFHIGGYSGSQNAFQAVQIPISEKGNRPLVLQISLDDFFRQVDLTEQHTLMGPGEQAVNLARILPPLFRITSP